MDIRQEIVVMFPEFDFIKSKELRNKSLDVWQEAMKLGGWKIEDLDKIPFTLLIPNCPVSFRTHTRAVTEVARHTAAILQEQYHRYFSVDMDVLIAGALLHDIGKLLEFRIENGAYIKSASGRLLRHPFSGAGLAARFGLPDEVVHIIATHAKEGDGGYRLPEAVIVHHADFINFEPLRDELKR